MMIYTKHLQRLKYFSYDVKHAEDLAIQWRSTSDFRMIPLQSPGWIAPGSALLSHCDIRVPTYGAIHTELCKCVVLVCNFQLQHACEISNFNMPVSPGKRLFKAVLRRNADGFVDCIYPVVDTPSRCSLPELTTANSMEELQLKISG